MQPLMIFIIHRICLSVGVFLLWISTASAVDGGWSSWSGWTLCSVSCGQGNQKRYRACDNPPPINGRHCVGQFVEVRECQAPLGCLVDGQWNEWSMWTDCSVSCGEGTRHRFRECNSPPPANGGLDCEGEDKEAMKCFALKDCPRDGKWSQWSPWSSCSVTCGQGGSIHRYRSCNNPPPAAGGMNCKGLPNESKPCRAPVRCPVNGQWSEWSEWTGCSVSCGPGEQRRWRNCDNPPPQHGGNDCNRTEAGEMQIRSCNGTIVNCPVDGGWTDWSDWGDCNQPNCAGDKSYSFRQRSCSSPRPVHGGSMCQGNFIQAGICPSPINCAVDGGWSEWSDWTCSKCNVNRMRECNNPLPQNGGKKCRGEDIEFYHRDDDKFREICAELMSDDDACDDKELDERGGLKPEDDDENNNQDDENNDEGNNDEDVNYEDDNDYYEDD